MLGLKRAPQIFMSFSTQLLRCDPSSISFPSGSDIPHITSAETLQALTTASEQLNLQQTVVFPTETVYGLGALALNATAVSRIFSTKGRPPDNPLIVHVSSYPMLNSLLPKGYALPKAYQVLMKHFWPGALTLLFPSNPKIVPSIVTANQPTVAIRMPSHPVARALIAFSNAPIAAPSANSSGKPSPTRAEHVFHDLNGKVGTILDSGACAVGVESTVVDGLHEDGNIRVLRPGGVTIENMERAFEEEMGNSHSIPKILVHRRDYRDEVMEHAPTTPGMKYRHYSPSVPVLLLLTVSVPPFGIKPLFAGEFLAGLRDTAIDGDRPVKVGILTPTDSTLANFFLPIDGLEWHHYPLGRVAEPSITAHRLFDGLLSLDRQGVDLILIEEIKEDNEGLAVMNRVKKAATESRWLTFERQ